MSEQEQAMYNFAPFVGKLPLLLKVAIIFNITCDIDCVKITFLSVYKGTLKQSKKTKQMTQKNSV